MNRHATSRVLAFSSASIASVIPGSSHCMGNFVAMQSAGPHQSTKNPLRGFVLGLSNGQMLTTDRNREACPVPVPRDELHFINLQTQNCVASGHNAAKADLLLGVLDESQAGGCTVSPHIQGA